ncbi:MAG: type I-B CRISPR-associated protein Cas7/Cst2/DevR [Candidatus Sericytochromatia bacterium]
MAKGLTITIVFEAMSLNYGEGLGNISELKKLSKDGDIFSYLSRQALRYDVYRMLEDNFSLDSEKVKEKNPLTSKNDVIQFEESSNIKDYAELDLFGYMKTIKGKGSVIRSAVVRFSPAISLSSFMNDLEFGSNKNFADRTDSNPNPFQFEHHKSLYSYTMTIDLDKIGIDNNDNINIENLEKYNRVSKVLDVIKVLNREIKGRIENLNPLFLIGGVYDIKNPFFSNKIKVDYHKETKEYSIKTEILKSACDMSFNDKKVQDNTSIGFVSGFWKNQDSFKEISESLSIEEFFAKLKLEVKKFYGVE